jgi:hypothetical protein
MRSGYLRELALNQRKFLKNYLLSFQAHKKSKGFQGEITTVYKVAKEDKVLLSCAGNCVGDGRMGSRTRSRASASCRTRAASWLLTIVVCATCNAAPNTAVTGIARGATANGGRRFDIIRANNCSRSLYICLAWHTTSNAEELEKVVKLPVDVATDCDGCTDRLDVGLCVNLLVLR